ncbi:MAG: hypothetical protein J6A74_03835 [Oscillospiraceae bacterium]|nr:hypothetical protein [Oscillospiraceae bacterium]
MKQTEFRTAGGTMALAYAADTLKKAGWKQSADARILLLPVPSFEPDGSIKGGGELAPLLTPDTVVIGGNLNREDLAGHRCIDLLQDPLYLSENAAITAYCAIKVAMEHSSVILRGCPVMVVGWGRIGKCLVRLLRLLGAKVSVAARSESDRALLCALGYPAVDLTDPKDALSHQRILFNTVPAMVLPRELTRQCRQDCLMIDLASSPGIDVPNVIWARGLPNKYAPESSGQLIAKILEKEFSA